MQEKNSSLTRSWLVVLSAGAFFFYSFIQMTLFSTQEMKTYFSETLSITDPATFGVFAGMFLNACVIFLIPAGILLDKVSVKKLIMGTLVLATASVFGLAFVKNLQLAMVFRFLTGVSHCIAFMAPLRLAPRWFPSRRLALVTGLVITFAVSGGLISQTPMYWSITALGGQTTMILNGFLGVAILVLVSIFVKDRPAEDFTDSVASSADTLPFVKGLKIAVTNKQNWFAGLYIGLLNLSVLLLGAIWGTNYLKFKNPDLSSEVITSIIGMIFIGTMIGSPLCGWISDKVKSRKWSMLVGSLVSLLIMMGIMFTANLNAGILYVLFFLLGLVTAAQTIGYPVIAESNKDNVLGTANGFSAVLIMGMAAIAQPLFGTLINLFGGETVASYNQAIYLMPVSFSIALICTILMYDTFKK